MTIHQPYAAFIALRVKTIETRTRPTKIRERIAIHAAARMPVGVGVGLWHIRTGGRSMSVPPTRWPEFQTDVPLPLGVIVATAEIVDCLPMCDWRDDKLNGQQRILLCGDSLWRTNPRSGPPIDITDQLPYGDYQPGRWAWMLANIEPLTTPVPFKGGQGWSKTWEPT